jgi:hypothetical protein
MITLTTTPLFGAWYIMQLDKTTTVLTANVRSQKPICLATRHCSFLETILASSTMPSKNEYSLQSEAEEEDTTIGRNRRGGLGASGSEHV